MVVGSFCRTIFQHILRWQALTIESIGSVEFGSMITTDGIAPNRFNPETGKIQDAYFAILKTK
jgi:hypothetical protein